MNLKMAKFYSLSVIDKTLYGQVSNKIDSGEINLYAKREFTAIDLPKILIKMFYDKDGYWPHIFDAEILELDVDSEDLYLKQGQLYTKIATVVSRQPLANAFGMNGDLIVNKWKQLVDTRMMVDTDKFWEKWGFFSQARANTAWSDHIDMLSQVVRLPQETRTVYINTERWKEYAAYYGTMAQKELVMAEQLIPFENIIYTTTLCMYKKFNPKAATFKWPYPAARYSIAGISLAIGLQMLYGEDYYKNPFMPILDAAQKGFLIAPTKYGIENEPMLTIVPFKKKWTEHDNSTWPDLETTTKQVYNIIKGVKNG